jgi:pimeloyl-ACP methyl ester carboxylesterase
MCSDDVWRGENVASGDGRPVLLVPGFLAGDGTLATMTQWLRACGYRTTSAGIRWNVDCSEESCRRIEARLEMLATGTGQRVAIVGQSRGGVFAKAVAARRPDLVSGIVTLGSPLRSQLALHPLVLAQIAAVAALGFGRVPGMLTWQCLRGPCCQPFRAALDGPFPADVRFVSLYSRTDGVVDWHACLNPAADAHVEVDASHCGMSRNASVYRAVGAALAELAPPRAPSAPA